MIQVRTWVRRAEEGSLYVLLFLLPFSKAAIEICFAVMLVGWIVRRCDPVTRRDTIWVRPDQRTLLIAIGVYLLACALSIVGSDLPQQGWRTLFSKWTEYLLFTVLVTDLARRPGVARRSLAALAVSAVLVMFEGVWQELFDRGLFRGYRAHTFGRMIGPYESPGDLATYLMVVIPPMLTWAASARRAVLRAGLWLMVAALVLCLGRTLAMGAWLGLGAGLAMLMAADSRLRRVGAVALMAVLISAGGFLQWQGQLSDVVSVTEIGKQDRLHMWQAAMGMIRDRPLVGQGLNTFMAKYVDYWVGGERMPRYAHNCYLQIAAETGLVGLLAFMALLGALYRRMFTGWHRMRSHGDAWLLLGLIAGLTAFLVQAAVDTNFYALRQASLFWVLAGLIIGWAASAEPADAP